MKPIGVIKTNSKEKTNMSNIKINKIILNNFRFFTDDINNNTFEPNGSNMLIYGENGSGKSSLFKAFEFLSNNKLTAEELIENKNKFNENTDVFIQFEFDKDKPDRRIDEDYKVDENDLFIQNLSIFKPILNYQKLLQVSYSENSIDNEKNLYSFFKAILEEYPIENSKVLKDLQGEIYFSKFKEIILSDLLEEINLLLKKFDDSFKITNIRFDGFERTVFLDIEYYDKSVDKYHLFLNEARLSALAMSVYFSIIKKQFNFLTEESLKILVLDDVLISLDMNNRLNLIDILKEELSDSSK
jgi:energy-coupling factor transporter ATP-binding protein EcfA2